MLAPAAERRGSSSSTSNGSTRTCKRQRQRRRAGQRGAAWCAGGRLAHGAGQALDLAVGPAVGGGVGGGRGGALMSQARRAVYHEGAASPEAVGPRGGPGGAACRPPRMHALIPPILRMRAIWGVSGRPRAIVRSRVPQGSRGRGARVHACARMCGPGGPQPPAAAGCGRWSGQRAAAAPLARTASHAPIRLLQGARNAEGGCSIARAHAEPGLAARSGPGQPPARASGRDAPRDAVLAGDALEHRQADAHLLRSLLGGDVEPARARVGGAGAVAGQTRAGAATVAAHTACGGGAAWGRAGELGRRLGAAPPAPSAAQRSGCGGRWGASGWGRPKRSFPGGSPAGQLFGGYLAGQAALSGSAGGAKAPLEGGRGRGSVAACKPPAPWGGRRLTIRLPRASRLPAPRGGRRLTIRLFFFLLCLGRS